MSTYWERLRSFARRRQPGSWLLLLALLGGIGAAAWVSRHPDSPVLERATRWPLIGPLAERVRDSYRPAPPREPPAPPEPVVIWIHDAEPPAATRPAPVGTAEPVAPGEPASAAPAPVAPEPGDDPSGEPPLGRATELTLPLPGRPADPGRLERARGRLGAGALERRAGPYRLVTDVADATLLARADRLASGLEALFAARYGLRAVGEARETIVLFADDAAYRAEQAADRELAPVAAATGHAGHGLVLLYRGERHADEVLGTLAHELAHLLTRRAIGPALPPWLDEGIADDLGASRIDTAGNLLPDTFSRSERPRDREVEISGGEAGLRRLVSALVAPDPPRVETLLARDWESFVAAPGAELAYAQATCLVRFLLAERELAGPFRGFLAAIAGGAPATPDALLRALGRSADELDRGLRAWVFQRGAGLTVMGERGRPSDNSWRQSPASDRQIFLTASHDRAGRGGRPWPGSVARHLPQMARKVQCRRA